MALFKMDPTYAAVADMLTIAGSFIPKVGFVGSNAQILPSEQTFTAQGVAGNQVSNAISPRGLRINIFQGPNPTLAIPAGNTANLPPGVAQCLYNEFVLDCNGFPGDLVSATANLIPQAHNATQTYQADISAIDTVNKLVYIQYYNNTTGAPAVVFAACLIAFQVIVKDNIGV